MIQNQNQNQNRDAGLPSPPARYVLTQEDRIAFRQAFRESFDRRSRERALARAEQRRRGV